MAKQVITKSRLCSQKFFVSCLFNQILFVFLPDNYYMLDIRQLEVVKNP
jgi:hypothetical protein